MTKDGDGRNLPGQQYPKEQARRACHRPQHRQRSSQRQWGRRPAIMKEMYQKWFGGGKWGYVGNPKIGHVIKIGVR